MIRRFLSTLNSFNGFEFLGSSLFFLGTLVIRFFLATSVIRFFFGTSVIGFRFGTVDFGTDVLLVAVGFLGAAFLVAVDFLGAAFFLPAGLPAGFLVPLEPVDFLAVDFLAVVFLAIVKFPYRLARKYHPVPSATIPTANPAPKP